MKRLILLTSLIGTHCWASSALISDRLVQNLDCRKISKKQIFAKINPDAFGSDLHLGLVNWQSGYLGQCWSLSRFQRLTFYLHRDRSEILTSSDPLSATDMVRGYSDEQSMGEGGPVTVQNRKIPYSVFSLRDLVRRYPETGRSLTQDIESFQTYRFHQPGNLKMGLGSGALSAEENIKTFQRITQNLDQGRLVLVNLRATQTSQHVVVIKKYARTENNQYVKFQVYDSNQPYGDRVLWYSTQTNQFISPGIMGPFWAQAGYDRETPLGTFIVDENEMTLIEDALVKYYRQACQGLEKK